MRSPSIRLEAPERPGPKQRRDALSRPDREGRRETVDETTILDPVPKLRVHWYEPSPGVKIPITSIQLDIFHSSFDPTNLGASPHTRHPFAAARLFDHAGFAFAARMAPHARATALHLHQLTEASVPDSG